MGRGDSHFNVSVGSDGQSHKTVSTNHNLSEEKGEPKRYRTEVLSLNSLTPSARPNRLTNINRHTKPYGRSRWILTVFFSFSFFLNFLISITADSHRSYFIPFSGLTSAYCQTDDSPQAFRPFTMLRSISVNTVSQLMLTQLWTDVQLEWDFSLQWVTATPSKHGC